MMGQEEPFQTKEKREEEDDDEEEQKGRQKEEIKVVEDRLRVSE